MSRFPRSTEDGRTTVCCVWTTGRGEKAQNVTKEESRIELLLASKLLATLGGATGAKAAQDPAGAGTVPRWVLDFRGSSRGTRPSTAVEVHRLFF